MGKEILVNAANRETRIAVIDDRQLVELRIEREEPVVGNVYKGRVENVLPGMDAAFIDIGLERNAFLYVADILPESAGLGDEADEEVESDEEADDDEKVIETDEEYDDSDEVISATGIEMTDEDAELVAEANAQLAAEDAAAEAAGESQTSRRPPPRNARQDRRPPGRRSTGPGRGRSRRHVPIQELVQTKQELVVQVVKGPRGTKGSRVSTRMSFPGRYLVLMPEANNLGVSRKIEEARERDRLKKIVEKFRQSGFGIIVRTEAEGRQATDLYQDYLMLVETWQKIAENAKVTPAPGMIHQDISLIYTIIRDAFGSDVDKLILDSPDDYSRAQEIITRISPDLSNRIHLYDGAKPMFEQYKIEDDIERLLRRKVWLRSGGYLVIDQTEALTSIDINTGKFTGSTGLSDTIVQTNMEATGEIARQLRLRDIGGMIVLDFIDMDNPRDKKLVTDALVKALKNDRSRTKISSISPLGLIEMTRKRTKETVDVAMTDTCPYCHGLGRVASAETVSMQVEREIEKKANTVNSEAILVIVHPDVAAQLVGPQGDDIEKLERQVHRAIYVRSEPHWHIEKFQIEPGTMQRIEQAYPLPKRGTTVECAVIKHAISSPPWVSAHIMNGYQVDISNGGKFLGQNVRVRLQTVTRSLAIGETLMPGKSGGQPQRGERSDDRRQKAGATN